VRQEAARLADRLEWSSGQLSQYRATLETFEDGILILSPARELIAINQAAKALLGVSDEPALSEAVDSLFEQLIDAAGWRARDPVHIRWNGRQLVGILTPLNTPEGEFLGRAVVLRDITREQQIEMAVQRQVDRISRRVEASVASFTGYASLLALGSASSLDRNRQSLAGLQTSSESIADLVDDLLLVTETLRGTIRLVPELVDMRRVLEAAVAAASSNAEEKRQKLILNLSPDLCPVHGDPHRLKQIVGKLLASAVYYTPEGECITIEGSSVLLRDDRGLLCRHLVVRVHDCGAGAPPEGAIEDLDTFHRVKNLASPEAGGTGLGLIGAKKLVEAHGGSIWAEGAVDGGCVLSFTIPVGEAAEARGTR
jgi:signal transduction histidine kinase